MKCTMRKIETIASLIVVAEGIFGIIMSILRYDWLAYVLCCLFTLTAGMWLYYCIINKIPFSNMKRYD